jgi:phi13 family phage major tail protein
MKTKRPMIKETVGSLYYAFNIPETNIDFDVTKYEETVKSDVVKNIKTTENAESVTVRASGKDYETISNASSIEMDLEVIAVDPTDLARMRGEAVGPNGLVSSGKSTKRPFFAFGKVVLKVGGGIQYAWYPKCQLVENTDDIATKEETFSEQNDTIKIRAYSFDDVGNIKNYIDSGIEGFPVGLKEEIFFAKPIIKDSDLGIEEA